MTMTPERLAELDAVMAKATDGNWGWCAAGARLYASPKGAMYSENVLLVHDPKWQANETDRAAIVALHNAYPDLKAHIEWQSAEIERLRNLLK